jgi:Dolichyl-phosphate-mannose-protein mannosyltransferase
MALAQSLALPLTRPRRAERVDAAPTRTASFPLAVALSAAALAIAATIWSAWTHSMVLYGDARAHMDVARHVTDGLRPGLTQLGSVWLPLPHILLVPLVAITPLWHSGVAGAIVGGTCFVYSTVRMYTLVDELTNSRLAAWCAFAVYASNLNLLYVQSTALTEPVLLAFFIGAVYHLARWTRTRSVRSLACAAGMTLCASLTRYEGWFLLATAGALVIVWSRLTHRRHEETEANVVLFISIGGYGIVLWVLYNLVIFHDPLYFIHSSFSAQSQQMTLAHVGMLGTKHNLIESVLTYCWAVIDVVGPVVGVMGSLAGLVFFFRARDRRRVLAVFILLLAPVAFNVLSLWLGQSTIHVPQRPPHGMWNDRYGVMALPFLAVAAGSVASRWRCMIPVILGATAFGIALMASTTPLTIKDGRVGTSSAAGGRPELAAARLRHTYRGGRVLADDASASPFMFASKLDLKNFVTIGFHPWYEQALQSPATSVAWVVTYDGDTIAGDMKGHPERFARFRLVIHDGRVSLYRRLEAGPLRHPGTG